MAESGRTSDAVGFISDAEFVHHETGARHPERPDRLRAIHAGLRQSGLLTSADPFAGYKIELPGLARGTTALRELGYRAARDEDLLLCHTPEHLKRVAQIAEASGVLDAGDTPACKRSDELARKSAGAAISAVDAVLGGEVRRCFVAGRPPGHHAEPERAMGFCLYSNVAIAARHALVRHGLTRVAIVDFDVHHGNGTQACLETDPTALFVSIHQHPQTCYPGTGFEWEIGVGKGKGFTVNVPLPPTAGDKTYAMAFAEKVLPRLEAYKPELLIISAGFDAHADDPLADMEVSDEGFAEMTRSLVACANRHCGGRVVSVLEGGYNLPALARSVVRHVMALQE